MVVAADSDEDWEARGRALLRHAECHGFAVVWWQDAMARAASPEHFQRRDISAGIRGLTAPSQRAKYGNPKILHAALPIKPHRL